MPPPPSHARPDESLIALFLDSVVDYAMFVLDPHGCVRSWNPGAERLKGYRADEIIGRDFSNFYTPEDREAGLPAALLARAVAEGRVVHRGWRVRKDGTRFFGDVTITALWDDDGELRGFAKVTRDRTDQYEADQAMARALERERQAALELGRAHEVRTQFMAAVSHDLQTPIGAIQGSLGLLPQEDDDDAALVEVIQRNLDRLAAMTRQLSEASRLERGRVELAPEPTPLAAALEECVLALGPVLTDREVQLDVDGTAHVDRLAFQRVLTNLFTNAHRHSPDHAPVVVTTEPAADDMILLAIEDGGPGVPADERDTIFEEFRQGRDRAPGGGLGLGLSIVRHYVEGHGGRVWVEDSPRGGARFCLTVPVAP